MTIILAGGGRVPQTQEPAEGAAEAAALEIMRPRSVWSARRRIFIMSALTLILWGALIWAIFRIAESILS
jgi:hypothetical protein